MIKDMAIGESLKELNLNIVDITKVPTLLGKDERIENYYVFLREEDAQRQDCTWRCQTQRTISLAHLMASPFPLKCSYEDSRDSRFFATNDDEHSGPKT